MQNFEWYQKFIAQVQEALGGSGSFPVVFKPGRELSVREVQAAGGMLTALDPRIALEYQKNFGDSSEPTKITARLVTFDSNPPAFMELHPMPLQRRLVG